MSNLTSKDKDGNILINGDYKVCTVPGNCSGASCHDNCIINVMIRRLYELEHKEENNLDKIDYEQKSEPKNPQVGEFWITK